MLSTYSCMEMINNNSLKAKLMSKTFDFQLPNREYRLALLVNVR